MWYGFFLGLGLLIMAISGYLLANRVRQLKNGTVALATVVELLHEKDDDDYVRYRAVFRFTTHSNEVITFNQSFTSSSPTFSIGEDVHVVYNEIDPQQAIVLHYFSSFGWAAVLVAVAMPMIVIGGGHFWARAFFNKLVGL